MQKINIDKFSSKSTLCKNLLIHDTDTYTIDKVPFFNYYCYLFSLQINTFELHIYF